jgi:anti-sigma-K factor RskA
MNLQSFIQSGLLESYVLGQCSSEETALVERMVAEHAEARAELASVQAALEGYATAHAVAPPAWMKGRILDAIGQEMPAPRPAVPTASPQSLRIFQSLAVVLGLVCAALFFQQRSLRLANQSLQTRYDLLQKELSDCTTLRQTVEPIAAFIRDTSSSPIQITDGQGLRALAYHNTKEQQTFLDLSALPAPVAGKYYQFWAIVDGQPVSMGMLKLDAASGWQSVPYIANAQAFAISEEDNPAGNPTPTKVLAVGKVG